MHDERRRRGPGQGDLRDPGRRCEREAEQDSHGDRCRRGRAAAPLVHGPTPAAGRITNTVCAIFSALRRAMLAFAAARAVRRRLFSATLAGRSRSWRAFSQADTPAIPAMPPTAIASTRPSRPRSLLAAPLDATRAP